MGRTAWAVALTEADLATARGTRLRARLMWGAAGIALVTLAGAAWLFRMPLVERALQGSLAGAGVDADFELSRVDLGGAVLRNIRIGPEIAPDAAAALADVRLRWGLTGPRVSGVRLVDPALRVRIDARGVSMGALDKLPTGGGGGDGALPPLRLDIENGRLLILTSAGAIPATFSSSGRLTKDFSGIAEITPTSLKDGASIVDDLRTKLTARTENGVLQVDLVSAANALSVVGLEGAALSIAGTAAMPARLSAASGSLRAKAQRLVFAGVTLTDLQAEASAAPASEARWSVRAGLRAATLATASAAAAEPDIAITAIGDLQQAFGEWTVRSGASYLGALRAAEPSASGGYTFDGRAADGAVIAATGQVNLPAASLDESGRVRVLRTIPGMAGSPLGPLMASGKDALDKVLTRFSTTTALKLDWRGTAGRLSLPGPLSAESASGARMTMTAADPGRPVLMVLLPSGALESGGRLDVEGGGLPKTSIALDRLAVRSGTLAAEGAATIADWRAAGGRLDLAQTRFSLRQEGASGALSLNGAVALDGRTEAIGVKGFEAPLRLEAVWGGGFRVTLPDRCMLASASALSIPGHLLQGRSISLCTGADGVLVGADAEGRMLGGFAADDVRFSGRTDDRAGRPIAIAAGGIEGRFVGPKGKGRLELAAKNPSYTIDYAADRRISFTGALMSARTEPGGRIAGAFRGGILDDPALPASVTNFDALWGAGPESGRSVMRLSRGRARVTDKAPPVVVAEGSATGETPTAWRARYNPLQVTDIAGALIDGDIQARGVVALEEGARPLADFSAVHDLSSGEGQVHVTNSGLQFSDDLDLYEITELARGVVDGVEGPVGVDLIAAWNSDSLTTRGTISPRNVNLNAAALGPAEGISGDVVFNDLALLTTPPGQTLQLRRLNPGVPIDDGVITFQMLSSDRIAIAGARWPFAGGELAIDPQTVILGDEEFRMNVTLREVDVQKLLDQLEFKDLTATGTVEGALPLVFNAGGGHIVNGELRASAAGGTIKYIGNAGAGLAGAPQIAFDALKSFAYTDLVLELNGDLDGQIDSAIRFSGANAEPVSGLIPPGALPVPGIERLKFTGWPFKFNVAVRAPFTKLMRSSDGIQDARPLVNEAIRDQMDEPTVVTPQVDPPPPTPR